MSDLIQAPAWTRWPADGVITYQLAGAIDYAAAFSLYRQALEDLLASERTFVLDFTAATDIEARALEKFKNLSQRILEVHGRLTFEHVSADLEAVLKRTHFDNLFTIRRSST